MVFFTLDFSGTHVRTGSYAPAKDSKPHETYVGLTQNTFKTRFVYHKGSFNNPSMGMSTELRTIYRTLKTTTLTSRSVPNGVIYVCGGSILLPASRICPHLTSETNLYSSRKASKFLLKTSKSSFVTQWNLWTW